MSDTEEATALQPLAHINGVPLFLGDDVHSLDLIEASGEYIYYVLCSESSTYYDDKAKVEKQTLFPSVLRVEKTMIGRTIVNPNLNDMDLDLVTKVSCTYDLPKMPWEFVRKLDAFFRMAYDKHKTESILVLTFDQTYLGTDNPGGGWGCIAPKQENTAADCSYEMDSVMQVKPAGVDIVGTMHSHPQMSAFFSGTDHKDQDDWDGIHITQAWRGNGPSEYHIALIGGGTNWIYQTDQIFDLPPVPAVDLSEVDTWLENVEVKTFSQGGTRNGQWDSSLGGMGGYNQPYSRPAGTAHTPANARAIRLPTNAPSPKEATLIAIVQKADTFQKCPFCVTLLSPTAWDTHRCLACQSFFLQPTETLEDLIQLRQAKGRPYCLYIDPDAAPMPIVFWTPADGKGSTDIFSEDQRTTANGAIALGPTLDIDESDLEPVTIVSVYPPKV